jgi:ribonuclease HI
MIKIFTDGGSRGNPGPAALGVHITKDDTPLVSFGKTLGVTTNNIAEYSAAVAALSWILEHKETVGVDEEIFYYADSQLLISQITGVYKIKNANLAQLLRTIKQLEKDIAHPIHYRLFVQNK